jgi:hypothetical protein
MPGRAERCRSESRPDPGRRRGEERAMPVRAIGINHVSLEVGDVDEALAWY